MVTNSTLNQGIPQISYQFVDAQGNITQPWFQLLIALWNRTGGGQSPGFIAEVDTGQGLQGGPINGAHPTGTIKLANADPLTLIANALEISAIPSDISLTAFLDAVFGADEGLVIYRGNGAWTTLPPGTLGQFLETQGPGLPILWATIPASPSLLPWVNGDLPGPSLMATPDGQCIGVPV